MLIALLIVGVAAVSVFALRLLCVVFAGILLGVFLYRLRRTLEERTPLPYGASFAVVLLGLIGIGIAAGLLTIPRIGAQIGDVLTNIRSTFQDLLARLSELGWIEKVSEEAPRLGGQLLGNLDAAALLGGAFSSATAGATAAILVLFIGFFLGLDPQPYRRGILLLVPPHARQRAAELLEKSIDTL